MYNIKAQKVVHYSILSPEPVLHYGSVGSGQFHKTVHPSLIVITNIIIQ